MIQQPTHPPTSGRDDALPPSPISPGEVTVLVTGFAPFKQTHPTNPSYSIASSLPSHLPPLPSTPNAPRINLRIHSSPIRVSYAYVRSLIPTLYSTPSNTSNTSSTSSSTSSPPKIDMVLHIGMAAGRRFYTLETRAHRDGYTLKDIEGKCDEEGGYFDEDSGEWKPGTWEKEGYLEILKTGFEDDDLWRRCKVLVPDIDVRPSNDAGRYLCDFIYYASLTWFWKQRGEGGGKGQRGGSGDGDGEGKRGAGGCGGKNGGPVMFLHVPGESEPEDIERGREVAIALIRGMVLSWMSDKGE